MEAGVEGRKKDERSWDVAFQAGKTVRSVAPCLLPSLPLAPHLWASLSL